MHGLFDQPTYERTLRAMEAWIEHGGLAQEFDLNYLRLLLSVSQAEPSRHVITGNVLPALSRAVARGDTETSKKQDDLVSCLRLLVERAWCDEVALRALDLPLHA